MNNQEVIEKYLKEKKLETKKLRDLLKECGGWLGLIKLGDENRKLKAELGI